MADAPATPPVETPAVPPVVPPVEPPKPPAPEVPPAEKPASPEAKKPEEKPESKPPETPKAPEKYDLKLPEGSPLDQADIARVEKIAKENGFSNEEAQNLLEVENGAVKAYDDKQKATLATQVTAWETQSKNDKEIGGDNFPTSVKNAQRVIGKFFTEDFKKALNDSGLGNHPELIRGLSRIGKVMSDDEMVRGTVGTQAKVDPSNKLYPSMSKGE